MAKSLDLEPSCAAKTSSHAIAVELNHRVPAMTIGPRVHRAILDPHKTEKLCRSRNPQTFSNKITDR